MADINQKIKLQFETDLQQAKQDVTKLGELFEQSTKPTAAQGALSGEQQASLEGEISRRAQDLGISPDEVKKTLEDINKLKEQARSIDQQNTEIQEENVKLAEKIKQAQEDENAAIQRAGNLLGLTGKFSKAEVDIAREKLRTSKDLNISEKERKEILAAVTKEYSVAHGAIRRIGNAQAKQSENILKTNDNIKKQGTFVDDIRKRYLSLTRTTDERDTVEGKVTKEIVQQRIEMNKNEKAAQNIEKATRQNAKAQEEYSRQIKQTPDSFGGKVTSAFLYYQALSAVRRVARDAVRTITELDKALTDIAVVTSMTRKETWNLLGTYQDMAKDVGLTTTEVANLSIAFFRQGRSAVDALRLTETAAKFARIAAIDVNEAANFLTAAINGFNLSASDATTIIDKFAALGASAAASASEIAIALSKVAPAAASAGVEIDTLMAFVTKGIEATREAPENIGTAFKTIFARMRQLTDIGKTIEDGMSVNRVEDSLKSIGVELRDANGEFRDLDDVLIEVGKKWDGITRNQQAYVATTLAGTRQQTRLIALFEDFDRTLELIEISQDSAGVAAIQHAEFMTGLEATTTRLKTSFQQLITSFVNSDVIIGALKLLNDIVELSNTGMGRLIVTVGLLSGAYSLLMKKIGGLEKLKSILFTKTIAQVAAERSAALAQRTAGVGMVVNAKATTALAAAKGKATIATMIMNAALALNPLVWIAAAIVAIIGLVLAFKRVREANNTTNKTIARMKIVFDRWANGFKELVESIKNFISESFEFLMNAAKAFLNAPVIKQIVDIAKFLGQTWLTAVDEVAGVVLGVKPSELFELSDTEKAAADFRVLTNTVKENNKEIQILETNVNQLASSLKNFDNLSGIAFKTPRELKEFNEAVNVLKDNIQSTLESQLEDGTITADEFGRDMAILQYSNSPEAIADLGHRIASNTRATINTLKAANRNLINEFMDDFDGSWEEAIEDAAFSDLIQYLPMFAQEIGKEAIEAMNKVNQDLFDEGLITLDELNSRLLEGEEFDAVMRAIALDPTGYLDGIAVAEAATKNFFFNVIPEAEKALNALTTGAPADFARNMAMLNAIDLSNLTPEQINLFDTIFPNFENLKTYTAEQFQAIAAAGGIGYIRGFQSVADDIKDLGFKDIIDLNSNEVLVTAADQTKQLTDFLFNSLAVETKDKAATTKALLDQIFSGVVDGIVLTPAQQNALAVSLVDSLGSVDLDAITREVNSFRTDMDQIEQLLTKPIDKFTTKDQELLSQYPEIFDDLLQGTLDLNKYREEGVAALEAQIDGETERLNTAIDFKILQFEQGLISQEELERSVALLSNGLNRLELNRRMLRTEKINIEAIKEKYKMELDSLAAQKQAMSDAKKMRDLQKESADIARQSIESTRMGALGTIEAQFNRQQLNTEIAEANKVLQDNIMTAQLEAQQKILQDSQQKAIEDATRKNTEAMINNTGAQTQSAAAANRVADVIAAASNIVAPNPAVNIPNATTTTPTVTTNRNMSPTQATGYSTYDHTLSLTGV